MRIRFGPAGIPLSCKGKGTIDGIKYTADEGLDAFEVEFVRGVRMSIENAKEVGEIARERDVLLSCHCPYWINCCPEKEEKREIAIRNILQTARVAKAMKAWVIVFHPGYYMKRSPKEAKKIVLKTLEKVLEDMHGEGIYDVNLGLETTGKNSQLGTLEEVISLSTLLDQVVPVIDFAHIHARNRGSLKTENDYLDIFNRIENELGLKELHCHFSEVEFDKNGEKKHLPLGTNSPPFEPLAKVLREREENITIISESPLLDEDALKMKKMVGL
ncbi:MAG: TIM barrel protein [Candidatus Syntropharchaeia archaeon]